MFAEQILRLIAGLLVGIWVARYLGPEQFGVFSYALAFVAIFGSFAKLGLDDIVVRDLVHEPNKRDVYLGTAFWLKLFGAFITIGFVAFATVFTSSDHTTNLYIFIIASGIIFQSFEVIDFYFQSKVLSKFVSLCKITQLLLSSMMKMYFVFTGVGLFWFVVVSLVDQVTLAVSLYIAYRYQRLGSFYRHFDLTTAKNLLKDSWPLILSGLVVTIYMRIDQVMIKEMLGAKEVGIYSAAVRLSEVWYFIPTVIVSSISPALISAKKQSEEIFHQRLHNSYKLLVILALMIAIPMTFLSSNLIDFLYGEDYKKSGEVLAILIWAGIPVFLGVISSQPLLLENLQRFSFYRTLIGCGSNILLNIILIPLFGIVGAAIATIISYLIATFSLIGFPVSRPIVLLMLKSIFFLSRSR